MTHTWSLVPTADEPTGAHLRHVVRRIAWGLVTPQDIAMFQEFLTSFANRFTLRGDIDDMLHHINKALEEAMDKLPRCGRAAHSARDDELARHRAAAVDAWRRYSDARQAEDKVAAATLETEAIAASNILRDTCVARAQRCGVTPDEAARATRNEQDAW